MHADGHFILNLDAHVAKKAKKAHDAKVTKAAKDAKEDQDAQFGKEAKEAKDKPKVYCVPCMRDVTEGADVVLFDPKLVLKCIGDEWIEAMMLLHALSSMLFFYISVVRNPSPCKVEGIEASWIVAHVH
eukprot:gene18550-25057_t